MRPVLSTGSNEVVAGGLGRASRDTTSLPADVTHIPLHGLIFGHIQHLALG